jgi:membrane AbrB-like protein
MLMLGATNSNARRAAQWAALLVASLIVSEIADRAGFPAAYLLGSMLCGVAFGASGVELRIPRPLLSFSQAIIGCLVARSLTNAIIVSIARDWAVMLLVIGTTVLAAALVGWTLAKSGTLPGVTAAWGSSPGAASAMVLMSGDFGADVRLVAFMQYLRMLIVVLTASVVSRILIGGSRVVATAVAPSSTFSLAPFAATLAIAAASAWAGRRFRIPSGPLLVAMVLGAALQASGVVEITLPRWLLHATYAAVGWYVGLSFDREVLTRVSKATPKLVLSTLLLIGLCAVSALLLNRWTGIDPLTAYLATSPGGLDSIAVIAVGSNANVPFVLAMQTMRLFIVILTGPPIARLISRYA